MTDKKSIVQQDEELMRFDANSDGSNFYVSAVAGVATGLGDNCSSGVYRLWRLRSGLPKCFRDAIRVGQSITICVVATRPARA